MRCSQCGSRNPEPAQRCTQCGAPLSAPHTSDPSTQLAAAQQAIQRLSKYVPPIVAEGILHDQARLQGERRQVTILFADAVNFTRLSESLDAESIFDLINDLLSRLVACIHRYGGMVDKFTGDGLMAVFGAPIAHESDAERAVRAALDMQKAATEFEPIARAQLGAPTKIRIGIYGGPAVAGVIGTIEQAAYTVIGETVNLAARLESLARPGHILVGEHVYQQTDALFNFQAMGTVPVKGISQPVAIYEITGERSDPLPTRGVMGVTDIFLGRDEELAQLSDLLATFGQDHRGRLVLIEGEAGMGKSRLVSEALSSLPEGQVNAWQGRGLPYAQGVGYGIFRSLLNDALRHRPAEDDWQAQISPALLPFLRQILKLPLASQEQTAFKNLEPERIKQLTALALREWMLEQAQDRPLALILEDFHWADDLSRDALQELTNVVHQAPIVLLVVTRPTPETPLNLGILPPEEPLAGPDSFFVELQPLSPQDSRALLTHLVNVQDLPESLVDTLLTRAEGNPFYIEEFVRMLIEKEVLVLGDTQWEVASSVALQELEIPTTLRGLMMARIDRLPDDLRHILRNAAVIGLQFSAALLQEIERQQQGVANVFPALNRLTDLGLLVQRPEAGEHVYAFRHILAQETTYSTLLRSQRPSLHQTVAQSIEALHAEDLENQAEVLALHYDRARVRPKALHYALFAGERARKRFANREAIEYYSRALQLSQHLSDCEAERWQAAIGLGEVEEHIGEYEEAIACYRAALDESREVFPKSRARVMLRMGQVWEKRGDLPEAEGWLHQALAVLSSADLDLPELQAQIHSDLGWLNVRRGDLATAQEHLQQGLTLVGETEHYDVLSSLYNRLGAVYYFRDDWTEAAQWVDRSLALRERLNDLVGMARSFNNLGVVKKRGGDWDGALANYQRSLELMESMGEVEGLALACTNLGVLYTDRGDWARAEENLQRSFDIAQRIGHSYELAQAHMNLGRLYLLQERWDDCAQHLNAAIPLYKEAGVRAHSSLNDAYHLQGRLSLNQGQLDDASEWASRSHDLLREMSDEPQGESVEWGRYEQLMGRIAQARGDLEAAQGHLKRSATIFEASGSQIEAGRTAYWHARLLLDMNQTKAARRELDRAQQILGQLGAAADLQRVERLLAHLTQKP